MIDKEERKKERKKERKTHRQTDRQTDNTKKCLFFPFIKTSSLWDDSLAFGGSTATALALGTVTASCPTACATPSTLSDADEPADDDASDMTMAGDDGAVMTMQGDELDETTGAGRPPGGGGGASRSGCRLLRRGDASLPVGLSVCGSSSCGAVVEASVPGAKASAGGGAACSCVDEPVVDAAADSSMSGSAVPASSSDGLPDGRDCAADCDADADADADTRLASSSSSLLVVLLLLLSSSLPPSSSSPISDARCRRRSVDTLSAMLASTARCSLAKHGCSSPSCDTLKHSSLSSSRPVALGSMRDTHAVSALT